MLVADDVACCFCKAEAFPKYEEFLGKIREMLTPILDGPMPNPFSGPITVIRVCACVQDSTI